MHTNIELTYNPLILSFYDYEEIESMLYHEAFHPLTQKGSDEILVPDVAPELADYLSDFTVVYNEFVNYASQDIYYKTSQSFSRVKIKEISNYSVILSNLKYVMSNDNLPTPLFPHHMLINILSDAIYFRLYDQKFIESWSEKNNANAILK